MPFQEIDEFFEDETREMTFIDKNVALSQIISRPPYSDWKIVRIRRIEIGSKGWRIWHRMSGE